MHAVCKRDAGQTSYSFHQHSSIIALIPVFLLLLVPGNLMNLLGLLALLGVPGALLGAPEILLGLLATVNQLATVVGSYVPDNGCLGTV